jgi:amphi-Trp domain-containing protein
MGELETEARQTRAEVAGFLRDMADQLDGGESMSLALDGTTVRVDPTDPVTFKLEGESDWSEGDAQAKQSVELELVWWRDAATAEAAALDIGE